MELLLTEDVPGLGRRGQIVSVARGYARNYLVPRGLARVPTEHSVKEVHARAVKIAAREESEKAERMEVAKDLATATVRLVMKASAEGHLYGSVGPRQIVESLADQGFEIEEKHVDLDHHLKEVGEYDVPIALHPEVKVPVKVTVVAEEG